MKLYHGSDVPGLTTLRPFMSNHDSPYVYLTDNPTLPLIYAHNAVGRPGGFFPYWFDKEGRLIYDEYFPGQLRTMYQGKSGWVYEADAEKLTRLDKMPWVYLSDTPVAVTGARFIPDLYEALVGASQDGRLVLHLYEDLPEQAREGHRRVVRRSLEGHGDDAYTAFLRQHMPEVFD